MNSLILEILYYYKLFTINNEGLCIYSYLQNIYYITFAYNKNLLI